MSSKGYEFSTEELKKKMHSLRTNFNKTNKKVKESMKSGAGLNDVFKPKGWLFEDLRFLGTADQSLCLTRSTLDIEPSTALNFDVEECRDDGELPELQVTNTVDDENIDSNSSMMFDISPNPNSSTPKIAQKKRKADTAVPNSLVQAAINHLGRNDEQRQKHVHDTFGEIVM